VPASRGLAYLRLLTLVGVTRARGTTRAARCMARINAGRLIALRPARVAGVLVAQCRARMAGQLVAPRRARLAGGWTGRLVALRRARVAGRLVALRRARVAGRLMETGVASAIAGSAYRIIGKAGRDTRRNADTRHCRARRSKPNVQIEFIHRLSRGRPDIVDRRVPRDGHAGRLLAINR
jgi:hypothetical protein